MVEEDVIDISSDESDQEQQSYIERRAVLTPVITRVVDALGGYEGDVYRLGDEAYGCLKDLKKLWRKDDTDDERTVARIFWETLVLPNDLVPVLLMTAGKGLVEDKRAVACIDLMTAMTWPIDMAEELKELDEELDKGADYTQLLRSHLHYKAALLNPGVIQAMFGIILPSLAKNLKERVERDGQIINVVLHLIRNLAFIKNLPANTHRSSDQAELSNLQSKLIRTLEETHILQLLLTIAANTDNDPLFNGWNSLVLEILYLLFRGVKPSSLAQDQIKQSTANLQHLLATEERNRKDVARTAISRHSRFGTTIAVKLNPNKKRKSGEGANEADSERSESRSLVLHRQQAISGDTGSIMDITKRQRSKKGNTVDELARDDNISTEARIVLKNLANEFLEDCFNPFLSSLLKDIRSERAKITEKDNLRLLYVTKWFLEYFLSMRGKDKSNTNEDKWNFGLIAEVTERVWIVWVLKRMREAVEEKPKAWTELQAGIECLTQLLLLIDKMSSSEIADPILSEAAEVLQQQLVYNGEVLDIALESLRTYKEGTQSLAYLNSSVDLAYAFLRMLERWDKENGDGTYVRKKTAKKKRGRKAIGEEDGIPDVEDIPDEEEIVHETLFTFDAFEMKFANSDVAHTLLTYLARYKEFASPENMKRVVSLMHRQAVKAKAEGLFFKASTLDLFKTILADQKSFPRDQPYKDLINLINFILRRFFKALEEEPFLAVAVFFPKNRGQWKQYSSWEPEEKPKKQKKSQEDSRFPADVEVKKGYSWSDQVGIAIAALIDTNKKELVIWTQDVLSFVINKRTRIIDDTDHKSDDEQQNDENVTETVKLNIPSTEALSKISDEIIPYLNKDQADAATENPHLKLLFRLSKFFIRDEDELEWYIPAAILPSDLQRTLNVITQFLETPFNLDGKKASELLRKKRRRRQRRRRSPSRSSEDDADLSDEPKRKKKKKKEKEKQQYKSAQFIEDSDAEYGDMEAFLEKERLMREKASLSASLGTDRPIGMRSTGTKKRRRKNNEMDVKGKKKASPGLADSDEEISDDEESESESDKNVDPPIESAVAQGDASSASPSRPTRPKPRPIVTIRPPGSSQTSSQNTSTFDTPSAGNDDKSSKDQAATSHRFKKRIVISDDEDE